MIWIYSLSSLVSAGVLMPAEAGRIWQLCRKVKKFSILAGSCSVCVYESTDSQQYQLLISAGMLSVNFSFKLHFSKMQTKVKQSWWIHVSKCTIVNLILCDCFWDTSFYPEFFWLASHFKKTNVCFFPFLCSSAPGKLFNFSLCVLF